MHVFGLWEEAGDKGWFLYCTCTCNALLQHIQYSDILSFNQQWFQPSEMPCTSKLTVLPLVFTSFTCADQWSKRSFLYSLVKKYKNIVQGNLAAIHIYVYYHSLDVHGIYTDGLSTAIGPRSSQSSYYSATYITLTECLSLNIHPSVGDK